MNLKKRNNVLGIDTENCVNSKDTLIKSFHWSLCPPPKISHYPFCDPKILPCHKMPKFGPHFNPEMIKPHKTTPNLSI